MGIRNLFKNLRELTRTTWTPDHAPEWVFQGLDGGAGVSGKLAVPGLNKPAENVLMVYGCIMARLEAISGVPLRISRGDTILEAGPEYDLLAQPNQWTTWPQYLRVLETQSALYNAMAVALVGEAGGLPLELVPLCPAYLRPIQGVHQPTGTLVAAGWEYRDPSTGAERHFTPDQVLIHMGYNPHAPLQALSPTAVLRRTMQADLAAREQNLGLFLNDARPSGILHTDKTIDENQADEIRDKFERVHQGFQRAHKTAVLWGGLKYEKIGLSPLELEFLASLKFMRTDYYIAFRVTPAMVFEMIGETGLSQGSSTDEQKVAWWENVGLSELALIAGMHQRIFAGRRGDRISERSRAITRMESRARERYIRSGMPRGGAAALTVWFDDNSIGPLWRHRLARLDYMVKLSALGYRPDDLNGYLDLGLPEHPTNIGTVPIAVQPAEDMAAQPPAGIPAARASGGSPIVESDLFADLERALGRKWENKRKQLDAFLAPREKALARKYSRFFMEQRARVMERIGGTGVRSVARADADDALKQIFPIDAENRELIARLTPLWSEITRDGWDYFNAETGTQEKANPFTVDDPRIRDSVAARQVQGTKVNETTAEDLKSILGKSFDEGWTNTQLGDAIAEYYKGNIGESAARPMTAAQTQVAGIVNDGRLAAAKNVGGLKKGWLHGSPDEPRPAHVSAQERYLSAPIPLDAKFEINGYMCDGPGDAGLPVGEVANCTCMLVFTKGD